MKLTEKLLEFEMPTPFDRFKVTDTFNAKIKELGYDDDLTAVFAEYDTAFGPTVTLMDNEGDKIEVNFLINYENDELTPYAMIDGDDEEDSRFAYLPSNVPMIQSAMLQNQYHIDLSNLDWLDADTLERIVDGEEDDDDFEDFDQDGMQEAHAFVIRNGKKVKKKLVRQKRRKRLSPKQKQGIRKAVRKRKAKRGATNRKRKKSLKIRKRKGIKRNTNKRMKVAGTSSRKR